MPAVIQHGLSVDMSGDSLNEPTNNHQDTLGDHMPSESLNDSVQQPQVMKPMTEESIEV